VQASLEIMELVEVESSLLNTLLKTYKSIDEASGSTAFAKYERARKDVRNLKASLRIAKFKKKIQSTSTHAASPPDLNGKPTPPPQSPAMLVRFSVPPKNIPSQTSLTASVLKTRY